MRRERAFQALFALAHAHAFVVTLAVAAAHAAAVRYHFRRFPR